jgi:hypothetical protein
VQESFPQCVACGCANVPEIRLSRRYGDDAFLGIRRILFAITKVSNHKILITVLPELGIVGSFADCLDRFGPVATQRGLAASGRELGRIGLSHSSPG